MRDDGASGCQPAKFEGSGAYLVMRDYSAHAILSGINFRASSCGAKHAGAQQLEACSAIHGTLAQLQPIDLTFDLTIAPFAGERSLHRIVVAKDATSEAADFTHRGLTRISQPNQIGR